MTIHRAKKTTWLFLYLDTNIMSMSMSITMASVVIICYVFFGATFRTTSSSPVLPWASSVWTRDVLVPSACFQQPQVRMSRKMCSLAVPCEAGFPWWVGATIYTKMPDAGKSTGKIYCTIESKHTRLCWRIGNSNLQHVAGKGMLVRVILVTPISYWWKTMKTLLVEAPSPSFQHDLERWVGRYWWVAWLCFFWSGRVVNQCSYIKRKLT